MKILVTGGSGFIGANFIKFVLREHLEDQIINLDVLTYAGNPENLRELSSESRYEFVRGDIGDGELVNQLMEKVDAVVNFAAESHVDRSIKDAATFIKTNVLGTQVLLDAAKNNRLKRFHHVSTDEVFGSLQMDDKPFEETTPYDPRSPYSASKAASDHLVRAYFHTFGLPITISNCSNNYGPYQFPEKLIPLFITNLIEGKKVPVYGQGGNVRDWLYVEDHCRAIDLILREGKIGETYCIGGNSERTNLEITKKILELTGLGEEMIEHVADRLGHDFRYAINASKIKRELGWEPQVKFDDGMKLTVEWYKNNSSWVKNIKDGSYQEVSK